MKKKFLILLTLMIMMLAIPAGASAKSEGYMPVLDDRVVFGSTLTIKTGEVLDGNIVIIGGVLRMEPDSLVNGDVVAIGSSVSVEGEVAHNMVAVGGVLTLTDTAVVRGDLIAPGSVMKKDENAQVYGQLITSSGPIKIEGVEISEIPAIPAAPEAPVVPEAPEAPRVPTLESRSGFSDRVSSVVTPVVNGLWFMFRLFAISAVAVVLGLFIPAQAKRTSNVIVSQPVLSGILGLLTIMIAGPLMVLLSITVILIPITLLLALALMFGLFFGWIAMGQEIGRRIGASLGQEWSDAIQAGIGTFILTFMVSGLNFIFWDIVGWMLGILIASVGLGAVLMTRFGTRDYKPKTTYMPAAASSGSASSTSKPETSVGANEIAQPVVIEDKDEAPKTAAEKTPAKSKTAVKKSQSKTKTAAKKTSTKSKTSAKKTAPKTKSSAKKTSTKTKATRKKTSNKAADEQNPDSRE